MILLRSLAFGEFPEIEPLNHGFHRGHPKMRLTVDTEVSPLVPERRVLEHLTEAFPGLSRHQCRAQEELPSNGAAGTRILLIETDPSANQAHLLEHLTLEMLGALDRRTLRRSGVTCAYEVPQERNDVFVECEEPKLGAVAVLLAVEAMNAALAEKPLVPLYPDVVMATRAIQWGDAGLWSAARLTQEAAIPGGRAAEALRLLQRAQLLELESYAMNLSGEPHYRSAWHAHRAEA